MIYFLAYTLHLTLMILLYNTLLTIFSVLLLPLILLVILGRAKYRGRSMERLGFRTDEIRNTLADHPRNRPVIWIHALSVGEVTSALPLVQAVRDNLAATVIVFTAATSSGKQLAETLIGPHVDLILHSPFDLSFAVRRYIAVIRPNLFILVETDFWPNWLQQLKKQQVPLMLVNGRISKKSFAIYSKFSFFFKPMFRCFDLLSMQTAEDCAKMIELGISAEKTVTLGNLKYDLPDKSLTLPVDHPAFAPENSKTIWVCGSTHPGEEEILFSAFREVAYNNNMQEKLFLVLAPRKISRGNELVRLASSFGLKAHTRSSKTVGKGSVLILDTIGELAACYSLARLAFIGGSLVAQGGHNPIEPAVHGVPILFGPHMEDFSEIARDLVACGGAKTVHAETLSSLASAILASNELHAEMSLAARTAVERHRGGVNRHLQSIRLLLRQ